MKPGIDICCMFLSAVLGVDLCRDIILRYNTVIISQ